MCEGMNVMILMPFATFMVSDFGFAAEENAVKTGILTGAFATAQLVSSIPWAAVSDVFGRKIALIVGLAGTLAFLIIFGAAKSYLQAIIGRVGGGMLNGNIAVRRQQEIRMHDHDPWTRL